MRLTEDERAALERWRECQSQDEAAATVDALRLMGLLMRLFPVRTCGDIVIRWDDPITPERLVACGWSEDFRQKTGKYHLSVELHLDTPEGRMCFSYTQSQDRGKPYTWITFHHYDAEDSLPDYTKPRNMGEVWQLMERCGIVDSECEHGTLP